MAKLTKEKVTSCLRGSALTLATLIGVIGGVIFGLSLRQRERKEIFSLLFNQMKVCQIFLGTTYQNATIYQISPKYTK
jgi:hypothetical protein